MCPIMSYVLQWYSESVCVLMTILGEQECTCSLPDFGLLGRVRVPNFLNILHRMKVHVHRQGKEYQGSCEEVCRPKVMKKEQGAGRLFFAQPLKLIFHAAHKEGKAKGLIQVEVIQIFIPGVGSAGVRRNIFMCSYCSIVCSMLRHPISQLICELHMYMHGKTFTL